MPPAVDGGYVKGVGKPVERQSARKRDGMAAVDQALAESPLAFLEMVEMDARVVLIEPGRHRVFGFFDGDAVQVVDLVAGLVIAAAARAAGKHGVISRSVD